MDVKKYYEKARLAVEKKNYDFAILLLLQILKQQPSNSEARSLIRSSEIRKLQANGGKVGIMAPLKKIWPRILMGVNKKNYDKFMMLGEKCLTHVPNDIGVISEMAQAAANKQDFATAKVLLESILGGINRRHLPTLKLIAEISEKKGDLALAATYYQEVVSVDPTNQMAAKKVTDLAARAAMENRDVSNYRKNIKDEDEASKLEFKEHIIHSEDELHEAIRLVKLELEKNTEDPVLLIKLADLLTRQGTFQEASQLYNKAEEIDPTNDVIRVKKGDLEIKKFNKQVEILKEKIKTEPTDANLRQKLQSVRLERHKFMIAEFERRIKNYPTNLLYRFELGKLYYTSKDIDQAIDCFQRAAEDPSRKATAGNMLGRCFMTKKLYTLAITQFKRALVGLEMMTDTKKDLLYNLALSYEMTNEIERAKAEYTKIYEVDINYRDVKERVENLMLRETSEAEDTGTSSSPEE